MLAFVDEEVFTGRSVELEWLRNLVNDALAGTEPQAAELRLALLAAKSTALASADRPAEAMAVARHALALGEQQAGLSGAPRLRPIRLGCANAGRGARWGGAAGGQRRAGQV
jgi:hypothetical protein